MYTECLLDKYRGNCVILTFYSAADSMCCLKLEWWTGCSAVCYILEAAGNRELWLFDWLWCCDWLIGCDAVQYCSAGDAITSCLLFTVFNVVKTGVDDCVQRSVARQCWYLQSPNCSSSSLAYPHTLTYYPHTLTYYSHTLTYYPHTTLTLPTHYPHTTHTLTYYTTTVWRKTIYLTLNIFFLWWLPLWPLLIWLCQETVPFSGYGSKLDMHPI